MKLLTGKALADFDAKLGASFARYLAALPPPLLKGSAAAALRAYSPDQPRDDRGRFGEGGGGEPTHGGAADVARWVGREKPELPYAVKGVEMSDRGANDRLPDGTRPRLSKDEMEALNRYTGAAVYLDLNRKLRGGEKLGEEQAKVHGLVRAAFDKAAPLAEPVTVRRDILAVGDKEKALVGGLMAAQKSGEPFVMNGYQSTTTRDDGAFGGNVKFEIHATHGLDLNPYSQFPRERELLLDHRSQYKVADVRRSGKDWHVRLEQIPGRAPGEAKTKTWWQKLLGSLRAAPGSAHPDFPHPDKFRGDGSEIEFGPEVMKELRQAVTPPGEKGEGVNLAP